MNERIRNYVEQIFTDAPQTKATVELRDEIAQNTNERYNDLIAEGKSEEDAFNIAVSGIGDTTELLETLKPAKPEYTKEEIERDRQKNAFCLAVAVMIYILSPMATLLFPDTTGVVLMFIMIP